MKTLIVKYLPSGERSNTKKLLDLFLKETHDQKHDIVDLLKEPIPFFNEQSMGAYAKRNYMGQTLSPNESQLLAAQDRLTAQLKSADIVVMAYPMHNFGMPGVVKTYLDAVMLNGQTFEMGKKLMAGKKSLTLFTSGGLYPSHQVTMEYPNWDTLTLNAKINFNFMGYDEAEVISTSLRDPATADARIAESKEKIKKLISKWYR